MSEYWLLQPIEIPMIQVLSFVWLLTAVSVIGAIGWVAYIRNKGKS